MRFAVIRWSVYFAVAFIIWGVSHSAHAAKMHVHWVAPTTNSDGSPLTNLAGYRVEWGSCGANGAFGTFQAGETVSPTATSAWIYPTNLNPVCARVFAFIVQNGQNVYSASSNVSSGVPPDTISQPTH